MQRLKPWFITAYMTGAVIITSRAFQGILSGDAALAWVGVLATALPIVALLGKVMILRHTPRTSADLPWLLALAAAGFLVALTGLTVGESGAAVWALAGLAGLLLYVFWYSRFGRTPSQALSVGARLPELRFEDPEGSPVSTSSLAGQPALLLFYRGNWCPLCMAQINEIANGYRELANRNVRVVMVSPQPHDHSRKLARRFDAPMEFWVDPGNRVAERLGIADGAGIPAGMQLLGYDSATVMPTVVMTDPDGTIIYAHQTDNYRVRPEPDSFLTALAGLARGD